MYGDFSRVTFDPDRLYTSVLKQQGRVELESDANENTAILLNTIRLLAADVIGRHGSPDDGFMVEKSGQNLRITPGVYYVDGIRVESFPPEGGELTFANQPHMFFEDGDDAQDIPLDKTMLIYLRAWEQVRSAVEEPAIREKALGVYGPDTCLRTRLVWQVRWADVKLDPVDDADRANPDLITGLKRPPPTIGADYKELAEGAFYEWIKRRKNQAGRLAAQVERPDDTEEAPCVLDPSSRYRGLENHLYRVEVHGAGELTADASGNLTASGLTFKWSRDNGSVVFPILSAAGREMIVGGLGRDDRCSLSVGDWVEVVDDAYLARGEALPLRQVTEVDYQESRVLLDEEPAGNIGADPGRAPLLRRWDQRPLERPQPGQLTLDSGDNAARVPDGAWLRLEHGIQVRFGEGRYSTGDYWLIPARVFDGSIEWPMDGETPIPSSPHGPHYHYAPLALNLVTRIASLRRRIAQAPFAT